VAVIPSFIQRRDGLLEAEVKPGLAPAYDIPFFKTDLNVYKPEPYKVKELS